LLASRQQIITSFFVGFHPHSFGNQNIISAKHLSLAPSLAPPFFFQTNNSNTTKPKPAKTTAAAKVATVTPTNKVG